MKNSLNVSNISAAEAADRMEASQHVKTTTVGGATFSVYRNEVTGDFVVVSTAESGLALITTD